MTASSFDARLRSTGLRPLAEDLPKLEAIVHDLDRAGEALRAPLPYTLEPLAAFRLKPARG